MYAKLFSRITESSLIEESITTRWVFVAMLAIADPDGTVIGTDIAIARRINVPLIDFSDSMKVLMSEDVDSNNQDHSGARIIHSRGERGYFLTGYQRYKGIKTEDERRHYMKEYMAKKRALVNSVNIPLAQLTHTEVEAPIKVEATKEEYSDDFLIFWNVYPNKAGKGAAYKVWKKIKPSKQLIDRMVISVAAKKNCKQWLSENGKFIPQAKTWLGNNGWDDEIESEKPKQILMSNDGIFRG